MVATNPRLSSRALEPITAPATWSATRFLLATPFVGLWWFVLITLVTVVGFATVVLGVGVALLALATTLARMAADTERRRLRSIGVDAAIPARSPRTARSPWSRLRSDLGDPETYRGLASVWVAFAAGPIWSSLTVVAWAVPVSLLATPVLLAVGFTPTASSEAGNWEIAIETWPQAGAIAAIGAILLPLTPRVVMAMARTHGRLSQRLLSPTEHQEVGR